MVVFVGVMVTAPIEHRIKQLKWHFDQMIAVGPEEGRRYAGRASVYRALKEWDKAFSDHATALQLKPDDWEPWHRRGDLHAKLGQWDKAATDYTAAVELNPEDR